MICLKPEVLKVLNHVKIYLFHRNFYIRQDAFHTIKFLLKTDKISDPEARQIISWITDHLGDEDRKNRILTLHILNSFLKKNIISDPNDRRKTALKIVERIAEDRNWEGAKSSDDNFKRFNYSDG